MNLFAYCPFKFFFLTDTHKLFIECLRKDFITSTLNQYSPPVGHDAWPFHRCCLRPLENTNVCIMTLTIVKLLFNSKIDMK